MAEKGFFRNRRLYFLALTTYMGSILFGYDTGVMGSVLALKSFKKDFGLPTDITGFANAHNAQVSSNVVSLLTAGCFFGAIAAAFLNDRFGRRFTLMGFSVVFLIGAVVQTTAHHHIGQIYAGRVIAGLGVGGMSSVTPLYVSENCPPKIRGRVTGLFQEFIVIGVTFAYWLNYGVALHVPAGTKQWRIPVGIQIIPGAFLLIGLCFLKESPRWLMKQGRYKDGTAALAYMRCTTISDPDILQEIAEIRAAIEEELTESEGVKWKECLKPGNRKRFFIGFCIMFWQQFSGTNSIGYYAPQIFQTVGVSKTNASLFATGIYGTVKVCTTAVFLFIGIDRLGRRKSLLFGAAWMGTAMFIIGGVLHAHPPTNVNVVSHASIAMVVFIYLFVVGYSCSWGPIPWVYLSEIFPTRLRPYGVGMGAATQWLFNFCITEITPSAINHLGWKTFLMFGIFCMSMGTWAFFFIKETKGKSLEEMDVLFGVVDENTRREHVERVLNKGTVVDETEIQEGNKGASVQLENAGVK